MTEPKFDTGPDSKLAEYELREVTSLFGTSWEVKGKRKDGSGFQTRFSKGDQHESYTGAKCLNWREL